MGGKGRVRKRWWAAVGTGSRSIPTYTIQGIPKFQALCEAALNDTSLCEAVRYGNRLGGKYKDKELAKRKGSFGNLYEYGIKELEN